MSGKPVVLEKRLESSIWGNRPFMMLWTAQALSQTAQNAIWFALMVMIEELTQSTTQIGIAIVSFILPSIIFTVPAGVLVDRVDKRLVLVLTNWLRAVAVIGYIMFHSSVSLIYSVTFAFSIVSQFFLPAEAAMIPALVGRARLITANSLFNLTFTLSQLVGIVFMAPIMIKLLGLNQLFIAISVLFVVCGFLVLGLPPSKARRGEVALQEEGARSFQSFFRDLHDTWVFIRGDRLASLALGMLTAAATLTLITAMLAPRYVVSVLGIRADDTVYVLAPAGFGMALGAATIGRLTRWVPKELLILAGSVGVGFGLLFLAVVSPVWWFIFHQVLAVLVDPETLPRLVSLVSMVGLVAGVLGLSVSMVLISSQTILQEIAPVESRGRIFAVQITLGNVASILPLVFVGEMADRFGMSQVLVLLSVVMFGLAYVGRRAFGEKIWGGS